MSDQPTGYVAKLVTTEELLLNIGEADGVQRGDYFDVLDESTMNVKDPKTGEDLGSLDRVKTRVQVIRTGEKLSLAKAASRNLGISSAARIMAGDPPSTLLTSHQWREGVRVGDPVRFAGRPKT